MAGESANVGYAQNMHLRRRKNAANARARGDLNFMSSHFWSLLAAREIRPATSISNIMLAELIFDVRSKKDEDRIPGQSIHWSL